MKPVVGIIECPYIDKDGDAIFEVFHEIVNKINKHGGIPIGIFPTQVANYVGKKHGEIPNLSIEEKEDLKEILNRCDAIIKPGAIRIYNYERLIYDYAVERDLPFLGIGSGMQLMSNYGIREFMSKIRNDEKHNNSHYINILKNTLLEEIIKEERILVNSKQNYHIRNSGLLTPNAYSDEYIIEAIEKKGQLFHLGVQWHPELLDDVYSELIFDRLVESAKIKRK